MSDVSPKCAGFPDRTQSALKIGHARLGADRNSDAPKIRIDESFQLNGTLGPVYASEYQKIT
jgi:hypothetical protein